MPKPRWMHEAIEFDTTIVEHELVLTVRTHEADHTFQFAPALTTRLYVEIAALRGTSRASKSQQE